ncbi:Condensation domain protein [Rubripirellula obstinata]|uniref:Condensation domain protein n=1 Tax=Rubripirellula obstinata TaxID=406547 RepID=A0A5B1CHK1_9BACT|nr:hypothetical protein [Rubripirellula obstinata]KAA1259003.1 Condensation domain protein [Rubripirellula obstinata]
MPNLSESIQTTAVERYLARSDHDDGMVFDVSISLEGQIDLKRLTEAWQDSIIKSPQMYFCLRGRGKNQTWKSVPFSTDLFEVKPNDDTSLNVRRGISARLSLIPTSDSTNPEVTAIKLRSFRLKFSFHHAACDGVGAARVIYQTMQRYHDRNPRAPRKAEAQAVSQDSTKAVKTVALPELRNFWATVRGRNVRLDRHATKRFRLGGTQPSTADATLAFLELGGERSDQIRETLRRRNMAVNDFGVAVVLQALAAITDPGRGRYLSIMNPVQTRAWNQRHCTRNHIGFAFIRRRHDQLSSISETLSSVSDQMKYVRSSGIAGELSQGIEIAERIPGGLPVIDRLGWFVPTASVTCLSSLKFGKRTGLQTELRPEKCTEPCDTIQQPSSQSFQRAQSYRVGDATVKGVRILGPLQSRGQLSITMWDTGSGLTLSFRGPAKRKLGAIDSVIAQEIEQVVDTFLSE